MSKTQIENLIAQINELLNRPPSSAARVPSLDVIQQRDRLKHLRYRLENPYGERNINGLVWECNLAIAQARSQYEQPKFGAPISMQFSRVKTERQSTLLQPLAAARSNWTKDLATITNATTNQKHERVPDANEQIATLVGQTVRQTIEQTLAIERSRTIAEIDANLRSLLESQKLSQLSSDLQNLEYQKRILSQEIAKLESERQAQLEQLSHQQKSQQEAIATSLQSLNQQLRDRLQSEIAEALSNIRSTAAVDTETSQQELIEKVRQQTDRFLATLDVMFSDTFQSLEQQIQAYCASLSVQLEQMQGAEQPGEQLLGTPVDRIKTEVNELSVPDPALASEIFEADLSSTIAENSEDEDTNWYSAIGALFDLPLDAVIQTPWHDKLPHRIEPANLHNGIGSDESLSETIASEPISVALDLEASEPIPTSEDREDRDVTHKTANELQDLPVSFELTTSPSGKSDPELLSDERVEAKDEPVMPSEVATLAAIPKNGAVQFFSSVSELEKDFNSFLQELEGNLDDSAANPNVVADMDVAVETPNEIEPNLADDSEQATEDLSEAVLFGNFGQGDRTKSESVVLSQDLETAVAEASGIIGNAANPWMVAYGCLIVMSLTTAIERSAWLSEEEGLESSQVDVPVETVPDVETSSSAVEEVEAIALESLEIIEGVDLEDAEETLTDFSPPEIVLESQNPIASDSFESSERALELEILHPEAFGASELEEAIHGTNGSTNGYGTTKERSLIEFVEIHAQNGFSAYSDRFTDINDLLDEMPFISEEEIKLTEFADSEDLQVASEDDVQINESQDSAFLVNNIEDNTEDRDRDSATTSKDVESDTEIDTLPSLKRASDKDSTDLVLETIKYEFENQAAVLEDAIVDGSDIIPLEAPPEPFEPCPAYNLNDTWFLGIDFGGAYLRASLFNACTHTIYPLAFNGGVTAIPCHAVFPNDREFSGFVGVDPANLQEHLASADRESGKGNQIELNISHFKHLLKLGLPYHSNGAWQPVVQWSQQQQIPLKHFVEILKNLSLYVKTTAVHPQLLDAREILENLSGVILGHPTEWSDTYVLNLREAILSAGLVQQAEQIMVVDRAIAPLLALIRTKEEPQKPALILDAGAATTSLLVVRARRGDISRSNINSRSIDYAGFDIDLDIVTQLLIPHWRVTANSQRDAFDLGGLDAPTTGEPDPARRALLQQYLFSSPTGRQLLHLAEQLKIELSVHPDLEQWTADVGDCTLVVMRRELESQVLQPYIQRVNRELNIVLSNSGVSAEDIGSVFLIGGTMATPAISRWLSQKLPNASIDNLPSSIDADGLAIAPLYPYLLNIARQQYSDYFLLQEICGLNLQNPVNPNKLVQLLQNRGINAKACRDRILTLLQGDLPNGLFPWQEPEKGILLPDPEISSEMFAGRLFELDSDGSYRPNLKKFNLLRFYLQTILSNMQQKLNEPLVFPEFAVKDS